MDIEPSWKTVELSMISKSTGHKNSHSAWNVGGSQIRAHKNVGMLITTLHWKTSNPFSDIPQDSHNGGSFQVSPSLISLCPTVKVHTFSFFIHMVTSSTTGTQSRD